MGVSNEKRCKNPTNKELNLIIHWFIVNGINQVILPKIYNAIYDGIIKLEPDINSKLPAARPSGGKRSKSKRSKSKRSKSKRNKSKRSKSRRNKSRRK
jgi:hypothetical protein